MVNHRSQNWLNLSILFCHSSDIVIIRLINKTFSFFVQKSSLLVHFTNIWRFLKNKKVYIMKKLVILLSAFFTSVLKNSILAVHYFSLTRYYLVYVFFVLNCFSNIKGSFINIFSIFALTFILFTAFFTFVFLNIPFTNAKIENLLGKSFIELYLPGRFKGLIPLFFFILTVSTLDLIEAETMFRKLEGLVKFLD